MPKKGRQATRMTPGFTGPYKGAPQQGTLFDVRAALPKTGEEIGPRGYSLNRSRQFQQVFQGKKGEPAWPGAKTWTGSEPPSTHLFVKHVQDEEAGGTRPAVGPSEHPYGPSHAGPIRQTLGRAKSKLIDVLARSTASPEHLKGLTEISMQPEDPTKAGHYQGRHQRSAVNRIALNVTEDSPEKDSYPEREDIPFSHPSRVKRPEQRGPVDPHSELTLLHELGHHVSAQAETPHSEYHTPEQKGSEEGFADAYATTHYREDTRTARWRGRTDPREHTYLAAGGPRDWQKFSVSEPSSYREALGPQNVKPQDHYLNIMSGGAEAERHERPMLDEPLEEPRPFTQHIEGWSYRGGSPEEHREGVYKKAAQITNARRGVFREQRAEVRRRWGVNRNLGRQFQ